MKKTTVTNRKIFAKRHVFIVGLLSMLVCQPGANAVDGTLTFNGTITPGTCDLSVSPSSIEFGSVDAASLIGGQWASAGTTPFTVKLSGCTGVGGGALTPGVKISGTLNDDPAIQAAGGNKWLFKTGGTSKGFGVVVYTSETPNLGSNEAENDQYIPVTGYAAGSSLPAAGADVKLAAAVSTGRSAWSAAKNLQAGTLTAAVTFTFAYH